MNKDNEYGGRKTSKDNKKRSFGTLYAKVDLVQKFSK